MMILPRFAHRKMLLIIMQPFDLHRIGLTGLAAKIGARLVGLHYRDGQIARIHFPQFGYLMVQDHWPTQYSCCGNNQSRGAPAAHHRVSDQPALAQPLPG
jgi:hypothetical protein